MDQRYESISPGETMTDPLSERLEQANELCAAHLHSHLGANVEWLKKQLSDYFTSILLDEIAAAEEASARETWTKFGELFHTSVEERASITFTQFRGSLARHDAAVRERTLETPFAEREVCNAILRIAQAFHEQEVLG